MREKRSSGHMRHAMLLRIMAVLFIACHQMMVAAAPIDSLATLLKAYEVDKKLEDTQRLSNDLNAIATIYLDVQQPELGIKYIEKAIPLDRKAKRDDQLAMTLATAAQLYLANNEPDKATTAIDEAIAIDQRLGKTVDVATRQVIKASILEQQSMHQEAYDLLTSALSVLEPDNNAYWLTQCYNQLGNAGDKLGKHDEAIGYYKKALQQSIKCGSTLDEREAERGLWETLRDDKPGIAILHLERYTILTDSMYKRLDSNRMKARIVTSQHMEENKPGKISRLLIKWGGLMLLLMSMIMIFGLFYVWRKNKAALKMQRQAQSLRDHFFTNITNELQTPLTVIMSAGRQLVDTQRISSKVNKHIGELIISHGNRMLELVNQLLNIEKVKAGIEKPKLQAGNIIMFVRMLVENFTEEAHERMLNIEFFSPLSSMVVVFAPDYIRRIVHILIKNAINYTPRNGEIRVSLEMLEDNRFKLAVTDSGKGIPIEERQRIFEPFSQLEDGDKGVKTGLELSLVNQLVQTINGHIDIQSELGHGTTFTITFPVQKGDSNVIKDLTARPQFDEKRMITAGEREQQPLVFIVENNEDVAFFIANHLRKNYNLRMAHDGREAFRNAQDMVPDLIITNIVMPVIGGKDFIKKLRADSTLNHIPIIALTANTSEQERISCIEAGADAVLVKPFNSTELKLIANHLIKQHRAISERFIYDTENDEMDDSVKSLSKEDKEFIHKLIEIIQAQMAKDDIDMEHIAAALSLSRKQLRTRVMQLTGLNPVAYVLQVRLNCARHMIVNEDIALTTVANKCGFQNLSHFSKAFKQQFGISPLQFRKSSEHFRGQREQKPRRKTKKE